MATKIDLHMHSTLSDGTLTPFEIIDRAYENNVEIISIADHDTIEAYNDDLFAYAESKNIKLIKGVEISTKTKKAGIHILGYNYNLEDEEFKTKLYKIRNARHDYLKKVSEQLNELGYKVNLEELDKIDAVTKAHIALDVINNSENEEKLKAEFNHIPSKGEFIETIMNENCPAYVKKETVTPKEAASIIREAGGTVVLAHPVAYRYEDNLTEEDMKEILEDANIKGIEANYLYVDRYDNKHDDVALWNEFARKNNLFTTIGSDYHSSDGLRPEIGFKNDSLSLTDNEVEEILNNIK